MTLLSPLRPELHGLGLGGAGAGFGAQNEHALHLHLAQCDFAEVAEQNSAQLSTLASLANVEVHD